MKVGIVAKRTEVFASSSVISSCVEFYYFSMSRRFQLFFFNHFDQFSRVVLDWQLSISPTCSSLLGYTIHSFTHTLALHHHSSGYSFTAAKARTASLGRNQNFVRSSCVLRQQQLAGASVYALRDQKSLVFGQLPCVSQ